MGTLMTQILLIFANEFGIFYVASFCTTMMLLLCHSLVRSVRCGAFMVALGFTQRNKEDKGRNGFVCHAEERSI